MAGINRIKVKCKFHEVRANTIGTVSNNRIKVKCKLEKIRKFTKKLDVTIDITSRRCYY